MSGPPENAREAPPAPAVYALGRDPQEADRLDRQSEEFRPMAQALLDRAGLRQGQRTIDLGCGPRGILELLSDRVGPGGRVVGLDLDPMLLDRARVLTAGRANVEITEGDARHTGLAASSFDLVHARRSPSKASARRGVALAPGIAGTNVPARTPRATQV